MAPAVLTFSWTKVWPDRDANAMCASTLLNSHDISPLSCLLMDDGGGSTEDFASWADEGLSRIDAVLAGDLSNGDWGCDSWGSRFTATETIVHSQYDDACLEVLSTTSFRRVLAEWRRFIAVPPELREVIYLQI